MVDKESSSVDLLRHWIRYHETTTSKEKIDKEILEISDALGLRPTPESQMLKSLAWFVGQRKPYA